MKVLFVAPAGSDVYAALEAQLPPLGLAYLASYARQQGHEVEILDMGVESVSLTTGYFRRYDLVGVSADTPRYPNALKIAKVAKKAGIYVVFGGYHATFMDKEALETGLVDFIVRGEGEEIFARLLAVLEKGNLPGDLEQVDGISYLQDGKYKRNKTAALPENLDDLPFPARDLLKLDRYKNLMNNLPLTNLITSRGCPFDCAFCSSTRFGGKKWRYRSAKSIADELEVLYRDYGYRAFSFMDDNFTTSKQRIMDLADELEARKMTDIIWWCFSRVDILAKNEDLVKRMAEAGAFKIFLGLESANAETLDDYGKNISREEQMQAVNLLRKYGIGIHGSFVIGDETETEDMIHKTVDLAIDLDPESLQFSIITPFPGTRLYEHVVEEKRLLHQQWNLYDGLHSIIRLDHLSPQETEKILFDSYKRFYMNLGRVIRKSHVNYNVCGKHNPSKERKFKLKQLMIPLMFYKIMGKITQSHATEKAIAAFGTGK